MQASVGVTAESKTDTLRMRAVRGGAVFLLARLGMQLLQIFLTLIVVRLLHPSDYGLMATALAYIGLADILTEAGISRALVQRKNLSESDLAQAFTLTLVLAVALYSLLFAVSSPLSRQLGMPELALLVKFCGAALLLVPFGSVAGASLERDMKYGVQSVILTATALAQGVLVLGLAIAGWGVWSLAIGLVAARLVQCVGSCWAAGLRFRLALPTREGAGLLRFGLSICGSSLLWFGYTNADVAVISSLLGAAAVGAYSVALQLAMMPVDKVSGIVNQVAFSTYCRLQDDRDRMRDWFGRLMVLRSMALMPTLIGLALVASDAVPLLLGVQWRPAVHLLQLLAPVACMIVVGTSYAPLLNALGHPDIVFKYTLANTIVLPIAFFVGCRMGGNLGVCLAWMVTYPLLLLALIRICQPKTGIGVRDVMAMLRPVLHAVGAMIVVVLMLRLRFMGAAEPTVRLVVSVLAGIATFTGWLALFAPPEMKSDLLRVMKDLRGKSG